MVLSYFICLTVIRGVFNLCCVAIWALQRATRGPATKPRKCF